jgi:hypothetical protein
MTQVFYTVRRMAQGGSPHTILGDRVVGRGTVPSGLGQ